MKVKESPLILKDFFVLRQQFEYIAPDAKSVDRSTILSYFSKYDIDIDFMIRQHDANDDILFYIKVFINSNEDEPSLPGYSIYCECLSVMDFDRTSSFDEDQRLSLLYNSALSMSISQLRTFIALMTSMCPLGKYVLPSIDLNSLIEAKKEAVKRKKTSSNKSKKTKSIK
ncbi:hypothetical protein [Mucilaginibacter rubeus]|uniref:Preprotein translocase subunit SecB n=1 Tax=Mucilaginibacter rubeus TaxID=2027860 RepID=A0A5C1HUL8_9SPHI|nr:hypothetical protein [Mucilaginibacter rubeus]QEM08740.1 hypothetical protein DEO27_001475 [Mucilaginibacter rubeus]